MKLLKMGKVFFPILFLIVNLVFASYLFIPGDFSQTDHLRMYTIAYYAAKYGLEDYWLLNWQGGSFVVSNDIRLKKMALKLGVYFQEISVDEFNNIKSKMKMGNFAVVKIVKAPKLAVFVPPYFEPWNDAVEQVLDYTKIPYEKVWIKDILSGKIKQYDWLYLHHEDFTGQFGKFYISFANAYWFKERKKILIQKAREFGFNTVRQLMLALALQIRNFVENGGFLFAMCSATDTLDIALAAHNTDIVPAICDGTGIDPDYKSKLDFNITFAFTNFEIETNPYVYEYSNIDYFHPKTLIPQGYFILRKFSAKFDKICSILVQNHVKKLPQFLGQTTDFNPKVVKDNIRILAYTDRGAVKYLHGTLGMGSFTFLGGHDPQDYAYIVGEKPTDMKLAKHSPGYRLILNNILFPAVKKEKLKT